MDHCFHDGGPLTGDAERSGFNIVTHPIGVGKGERVVGNERSMVLTAGLEKHLYSLCTFLVVARRNSPAGAVGPTSQRLSNRAWSSQIRSRLGDHTGRSLATVFPSLGA